MNFPSWLRMAARRMGLNWSSGYESARRSSRRRGNVPISSARDQKRDLNGSSRLQMVRASRFVHRNSGFHRDAVGTMEVYAVGDGITPQSLAVDPEAITLYEEYWNQFSLRPELSNRFDLCAVQHLLCRAIDIDGEIFAVKTFDLFGNPKIQILETHQISAFTDEKQRIWDGIEFDAFGRPKFYHLVLPDDTNPYSAKTKKIPASAVLHLFEPEAVTAVRGIPPNQHGLNALRDHAELLAFETHATKQAGELGIVVTSDRENALLDGDFQMDVEGSSPPTSEQDIAAAFGGRAVRLDEGERVESFQSNRPNQMFSGFLEMLEREAAGGHVPYEILRDASKVGGASVRLLASKADKRFSHRQTTLINRFLLPLWGYVIAKGIDAGELPAVPGWSKVKWRTPRRITVDASREEQQARLNVESGLGTFSGYLAERGEDFDDWLAQRKLEAREILNAAGYSSDTPIPLWMIYKPTGVPIGGDNSQSQDPNLSQ